MTTEWLIIFMASGCYLSAHLLRSFRFAFLFGEAQAKIFQIFIVFQATGMLSYFIPPIAAEILKVILLAWVTARVGRSVFCHFYLRLFDAMVLLEPGSVVLKNRTRAKSPHSHHVLAKGQIWNDCRKTKQPLAAF